MRVVYVDVLFASNLAVNYLLLLLTARLGGVYAKRLRMLLGAALGAAFSVLLYFPALAWPVALAAKGLLCAAIIAVVFGGEHQKVLLRLCLVFLVISCAFAGGIIAIMYIFGVTGLGISNGVPYFDISLRLLLACIAAVYCILGAVLGGRGMDVKKKNVIIDIQNGQKSIRVKGFADSGNMARDPISGRPVIIVSSSCADMLFGPREAEIIRSTGEDNIFQCFQQLAENSPGRFMLVPCKTATGPGGMIIAAKVDGVNVDGAPSNKHLIGFSAADIQMSDGSRAIIGV